MSAPKASEQVALLEREIELLREERNAARRERDQLRDSRPPFTMSEAYDIARQVEVALGRQAHPKGTRYVRIAIPSMSGHRLSESASPYAPYDVRMIELRW